MENQVSILFPWGQIERIGSPFSATTAANILEHAGLNSNGFYFLHNGKKLEHQQVLIQGQVHVVARLNGGKGGFGSMLRAIGAQIEKTTNREACRDLSGRRLRDINEEKRLKTWITQQADRERDAAERKRQRLERLMAEPKLEFKDEAYEAARSEMTEKVSDAVEQAPPMKKKKKCLWLGSEDEDISSSVDTDDSDAEDAKEKKQAKPSDEISAPTKEEKAGAASKTKEAEDSSEAEEKQAISATN
ncbi:hypothetical protein B566_EDAN016614 [Ephemera danica]|nr:hypothetical protein B566_EDAN016614 [Ephemera danica]